MYWKRSVAMHIQLLIPDSLSQFYNFHPMFVHAPLGLLPVALLLFGMSALNWRYRPVSSARVCLVLGTIGLVAALVTGLKAEDTIPHNSNIHMMMEMHKFAAILVAVLAVVSCVWSFRVNWEKIGARSIFLAVIAFLNLMLLAVGDLGARMVYIHGAGVKPASSVVEHSDNKAGGHSGHDHGNHSH